MTKLQFPFQPHEEDRKQAEVYKVVIMTVNVSLVCSVWSHTKVNLHIQEQGHLAVQHYGMIRLTQE